MSRIGACMSVFSISGFVHGFPVLMGAGNLGFAVAVVAFFLLQGCLVLAEEPLRVQSWPRAVQHVWVVFCIIAPAPLMTQSFAVLYRPESCVSPNLLGAFANIAIVGAAIGHSSPQSKKDDK